MNTVRGLWLVTVAAVGLLAALGAQGAAANQSNCSFDAPPAASPRLVRGQLDGLTFNVLLPSDYATGRRYPVLYLLHGGYYNENTWLNQSDVQSFTAPFTGSKAAIVVMPDGGPGGFYTDWHDGTQQWESYHLRRLIPYIDAQFRTIGDRGHRAIAGFSIGGFGAMHYAARHPDTFVAAGSFSGLTDLTYPEDAYAGPPPGQPRTDAGSPGPAQAERPQRPYRPPTDAGSGCQGSGDSFGDRTQDAVLWHNHNPTDLAANLGGLSLYVASGNGVSCGAQDTGGQPSLLPAAEPAALDMNRRFDAALSAAGVAHTTDFYACGLHTMLYAQRDLHVFWTQMLRAFGTPAPRTFRYRTVDRDFSVWDWTLRADAKRADEFVELRDGSPSALTLIGSGTATVVSPSLFAPGARVPVKGAAPALTRADRRGRVTVAVDLGPAHTQRQFTAGAPNPTFVSRHIELGPATPAPRPARRRCSKPRRVHIRIPGLHRHERIVSTVVKINGRRVSTRRGPHLPSHIALNLPRSRSRITISATTNQGRRLTVSRRYGACRRVGSRSPRPSRLHRSAG